MKKILMKLMAITLALMFTLSMPGISAIAEAVGEANTAPASSSKSVNEGAQKIGESQK